MAALAKTDLKMERACPLISMVLGHVDDSGEPSGIPFERVSTTTHPRQRGIQLIVENVMAARNRGFELTHPNAAGIDIGSNSHFVAVPSDRAEQSVREFSSFTDDLMQLAEWLRACDIDTVAMESTGVYWIPLYELLESRGFTVHLVNARHVKNVSGRKSDVLDCQWLQQLMSFGLLRGAFRPQDAICELRAVSRQHDMLTQYQAKHVQHMQKALTQMNVQLANVISDIAGVTGLAIIRAIMAGERDAKQLAQLRNNRIRASEETIIKSLHGNWRAEHLFALKQAVELYDAYTQALIDCEVQLERILSSMARYTESTPVKAKRGRPRKQGFNLATALQRVFGVDLTRINGIESATALKVLAEVGFDLSRFKSVKHFCSWLGLCPGTHISGGKVLSGASKRTANRLANALKLASVSLRNSQSALGAYYRRLCGRMDKPRAITATAHKLARLIYTMLTKGTEYVDDGMDYYEERHRQRVVHHLSKRATALGFKLTPLDVVATT